MVWEKQQKMLIVVDVRSIRWDPTREHGRKGRWQELTFLPWCPGSHCSSGNGAREHSWTVYSTKLAETGELWETRNKKIHSVWPGNRVTVLKKFCHHIRTAFLLNNLDFRWLQKTAMQHTSALKQFYAAFLSFLELDRVSTHLQLLRFLDELSL